MSANHSPGVARAQGRIERLDGLSVVGWAHGPSGDGGQVTVRVRGEVVDVTVQRSPREDVIHALKLPAGGLHGFRFEMPRQAWFVAGSDIAISVDDQPLVGSPVVPEPAQLLQALGELLDQAESPARTDSLKVALELLEASGAAAECAPPIARRLRMECRRQGWPLPDKLPMPTPGGSEAPNPATVRGAVERVEGPVISGWAARLDGGGEVHLRILANGAELDCGLIRTERRDVQDALALDELMTGFEIEVPGLAWRAPAGAPAVNSLLIQIVGDGRELTETAIRIRREDIPSWVARERTGSRDDASSDILSQRDRQYRSLLVLEHATLANLGDALEAEDAAWLSDLAARYGLTPWVAATSPAPAAESAVALDDEPPEADTLLWNMQRRFNQWRLEHPDDPEGALSQVWSAFPADELAWANFLQSTVPYFCSIGRFDLVRRRLSERHISALAYSADLWSSSLALPYLLQDADDKRLTALLWRLAERPRGWLNTDCVMELARGLAHGEHNPAWSPDRTEEVIWALLGLLKSLHHDYWSRLHDHGLMKAMVWLLRARPRVSDTLAEKVSQAALQHYVLAPDFWALLLPQLDDRQPADATLRREAARQQRVADLLQPGRHWTPDDVQLLWQDLDALRVHDCTELPQLEREVAMLLGSGRGPAASVPLTPERTQALLQRLHRLDPLEPLRLAASPLGQAEVFVQQADSLRQRVRAASATPRSPVFQVQAAAARAWQAWVQAEAGTSQDAAIQTLLRHAGLLMRADAQSVGVDLLARVWCQQALALAPAAGPAPTALPPPLAASLKGLQAVLSRTMHAHAGQPVPPAAVCTGLWHLHLAQRRLRARPLSAMLKALDEQLDTHWGHGVAADLWPDPSRTSPLPCTPAADTLVVVYSCRPNLGTRVQAMRRTWLQDLTARGIPWCVAVGREGNSPAPAGAAALQGDVLSLDAADDYESLPQKTLALMRWVLQHTEFAYVMKIDDDCHVDVDRLFEALATRKHHYLGRPLNRVEGGTHRYWHQLKARSTRGALAIDKSPEPSVYADGGSGYLLSRFALARLERARLSTGGAQAARSAFMEDKLVGDLLALQSIWVSGEDYEVLVRRRVGTVPGVMPVATYSNLFLPSAVSPTMISHLDSVEPLAALQVAKRELSLAPARLWPTSAAPTLGHTGATNQLELLSPLSRAQALGDAPIIVVAVARNEAVMAPHFLAHYRRLGVQHFVFIDNLSDDGTREYLHAQPDVVLYSADTDYRQSHFGVAWQQAALAAHALGRWALIADLDEFLVYDDCERVSLADHARRLQDEGADAACVWMIDMYPEGDLDDADMAAADPFEVAPCFDAQPLLRWVCGSGCYSNAPTWLSALRHRLIPHSAPNHYTSQKVALLRYQPWMRLSEGLHYASNVRVASRPMYFAHFKYHAGFRRKVLDEIARKQHFNGAEEYRKYASLLTEAAPRMYDPSVSRRYAGSHSFTSLAGTAGPVGRASPADVQNPS